MAAPAERALGKAAVGASHHVVFADAFNEAEKPFRHEFRMLDDVCRMSHETRQQHLSRRELDLLPYLPLMFMARVRRFKAVPTDISVRNATTG
jgi:hypothetical protein